MAGNLENPSLWKLRTGSGVPYKIKSLEGGFGFTTGAASLEVLVPANRIFDFAEDMLPSPVKFGNIFIPRYTKFPGSNLVVTSLKFKSMDDSLPIDPFGFDLEPEPDTYFPVLAITVEFGPQPHQDPQPGDPKSFLEVSGGVTGDFIHTTGANLRWIESADKTEKTDSSSESSTSSQSTSSGTGKTGAANRTPNVPSTVVSPQTQWDVKWNMVPYDFFVDVIKPRVNLAIGKVNSKPFPVCFAITPTTLLFAGISFNYNFSWRNGFVDKPLISLTFKFLEKQILWRGQVMGHNDSWRPGIGWSGVLIDGRPPYEVADFNMIFAQ